MADMSKTSLSLAPNAGAPNNQMTGLVGRLNDAGEPLSVDVGMPVTGNSLTGVIFAVASSESRANVLGLAGSAAENPGHIKIVFAGPLSFPTELWDAVTGQTGGLTPNATYYLSAAQEGRLTTNPPSGSNYIVPVGFAINETTLMVRIGQPEVANP